MKRINFKDILNNSKSHIAHLNAYIANKYNNLKSVLEKRKAHKDEKFGYNKKHKDKKGISIIENPSEFLRMNSNLLFKNIAEMYGKSYFMKDKITIDDFTFKDVYPIENVSNSFSFRNLNSLVFERINPYGKNGPVSGSFRLDARFLNKINDSSLRFKSELKRGLEEVIKSNPKKFELEDGFVNGTEYIGKKPEYVFKFEKYVDNVSDFMKKTEKALEWAKKDPISNKEITITDEAREKYMSNILKEIISEKDIEKYKKEHKKYINSLIDDAFRFNSTRYVKKNLTLSMVETIDNLLEAHNIGKEFDYRESFENTLKDRIGNEKTLALMNMPYYVALMNEMDFIVDEVKKYIGILELFKEKSFDNVYEKIKYNINTTPSVGSINIDKFEELKNYKKEKDAYDYVYAQMKKYSREFFKHELGVDKVPKMYELKEEGINTGDELFGHMVTTVRIFTGKNHVEKFKNNDSREALKNYHKYMTMYQTMKQFL